MTNLIEKARTWAARNHASQNYGDEFYFDGHIEKVVQKVKEFDCYNEHLIAAAYLHDIVEDSSVTLQELTQEFGSDVSEIVKLCTDPEGDGWTRAQRKAALYVMFSNYRDEYIKENAAIVKCADRIVNHDMCTRNINVPKMKMYIKEFPQFLATFGTKILEAGWYEGWEELLSQYLLLSKLVDAYR